MFPSGPSKASSPRSPVWSQVSALMRGRAPPRSPDTSVGESGVTVHPSEGRLAEGKTQRSASAEPVTFRAHSNGHSPELEAVGVFANKDLGQ